MVETNIKALTQLVGKPLKDWDASDVDKIVSSEQRELLLDGNTVEYIVENSNNIIEAICTPIYVQISFNETMDEVEGLLRAYYEGMTKNEDGSVTEDPVLKTNIQTKMDEYIESDGLIEFLAAVVVLFNLFPDYDLMPKKDKIQSSLRKIEDVACLIPLEGGMSIFQNVLDALYFPLITAWYERHNELLLEKKNEQFAAKLEEYGKMLKRNEEEFAQRMAEEMAKKAMEGKKDEKAGA